MSWSLEGRTALITGAARGIGAEAARRLAARGMRVSLLGLEPEELEKVAAQCGRDAISFEVDVTDSEAVNSAVEATVERLGGIDVVLANAGIGAGGTVRWMDPDQWERVIAVNLVGVHRTIHACLPHIIERRGYVLPVASMAAAVHSPDMSAYAASKAGVEALADSLRAETGHLGVAVGCAYFSWIETDMVTGASESAVGQRVMSRLRGPMARRYPVSAAGEAIVAGVQRRSRAVVVPGWAKAILLTRRLVQPLVERFGPGAEEIYEIERAAVESGDTEGVFGPVGAGGEADARARDRSRSAS